MPGSAQTSVTTSATQIDLSTTGYGRNILVRNRGAVAVYLGSSNVSSSNGFQLDPGESVTIATDGNGPGSALYGVTASSSATVHVIQVG